MSITQTVKIPANHRLTIDVPHEIPAGTTAWVELKIFPFVKNEEKPVSSLKSLAGVETPIADSLLGVAANLGSITLDEIREERLAKYSGWKDFEDAVQFITAKESNVEFIITRNKSDYKTSGIPCMTPAEFITYLKENEQ